MMIYFVKGEKKHVGDAPAGGVPTESCASRREHGLGARGPPAMVSHRTYSHVLPVTSQ